jgi:hypothetical protein
MSQDHEKMIAALKEIVVTCLREQGFKGSFPHFRRAGKDKVDLLTFQFDKWGGGFVIEISKCPPDGMTTSWGKYIPPNRVTAWDMHPNDRVRLQPRTGSSTMDWFRYDHSDRGEDIFDETARAVLPFLEIAKDYWKR